MHTARYTIAPFAEKDLAEAFIVSVLAFPDSGEDWRRADETARQNWLSWGKHWADWLTAQNGTAMWAAKDAASGAMIGYARAVRDVLHKTDYLTDLYVLPQWQGAGLGTLLLQKVMPRRIESGWTRAIISTDNPAARRLYAQWGVHPAAIANQYTARLGTLPEIRPDIQILRVDSIVWEQRNRDILQFYEAMRGPFSFPIFDLYVNPPAALFVALTDDGALRGCGARIAECIGPVIAADEKILHALLDALLLSAHASSLEYVVFWADERSFAAVDYLRRRGVRYVTGESSALLTSPGADVKWLSQSLLIAPPYLL